MHEFYIFVIENWILSALFLIVFGILLYSFVSQKSSISPNEAVNLFNEQGDKLLIFDLRPQDAYSKGHIINSINLSANDLNKSLEKYLKFKDTPILIYCDSGMVSSTSSAVFRKKGFTDLKILRGGLDGWKQENLPIEQKN